MIRPTEIAERQVIGSGVVPDGRRFELSEVTYSNEIRGLGDKGVILDIEGTVNTPGQSIGFSSEDDAVRYLTSRDTQEYTTYDELGNEIKQPRVGLSTPEGMISRADKSNTSQQKPQTGTEAATPSNSESAEVNRLRAELERVKQQSSGTPTTDSASTDEVERLRAEVNSLRSQLSNNSTGSPTGPTGSAGNTGHTGTFGSRGATGR